MEILHATCVCLDGKGILIRGLSGSGKSDLALRLIDRGALLVADDLVAVDADKGSLTACLPAGWERFRGALEIRGIGIASVPCREEVTIELVVDLDGAVERMPGDAETQIAGIGVRSIALNAFEASASAKIAAALRYGFAHVAA